MATDYDKMYDEYYKKLISSIEIPTIEVDVPTEAELSDSISKYLRPTVDSAIRRRGETAEANRAELDADAASRGMLGSTFVSSVKSRENTKAASDVSEMESGYAATLAERIFEAMSAAEAKKLEADMFNAESRMTAEGAARDGAMAWLQTWIASRMGGGGGGSYRSPEEDAPTDTGNLGSEGLPRYRAIPYSVCVRYLNTLNIVDARQLFYNNSFYWRARRQEIRDSITPEQFIELRNRFTSTTRRREDDMRRSVYER